MASISKVGTFDRCHEDDGTMSLLLTPNHRYAQHAAACIASLLDHSARTLHVVVASTENPEHFAERLRRSFAGNARLLLEFRHVTLPETTHFPTTKLLSTDMYVRFWAHELLPQHSRVIYLDSDIIATGPLDELWTFDMQGKTLGAVPIPNSTRVSHLGLSPGSLYFNSGVLLMNLDRWRMRDYGERCVAWLRENPNRAYDPDQDALNMALQDDWVPLHYKWNVINPFFRPSKSIDINMSDEERLAVIRDARLVHFNSRHKPWVYLDNHPKQQDYMRYLRQTDWRDWRPPDRTPLNIVRKQLSRSLPLWVKQIARGLLQRPD